MSAAFHTAGISSCGLWVALLLVAGSEFPAFGGSGEPSEESSLGGQSLHLVEPPQPVDADPAGVKADPKAKLINGLLRDGILLCNGLDNFVDAAMFKDNPLMNRDKFVEVMAEKSKCPLHSWPHQQIR